MQPQPEKELAFLDTNKKCRPDSGLEVQKSVGRIWLTAGLAGADLPKNKGDRCAITEMPSVWFDMVPGGVVL